MTLSIKPLETEQLAHKRAPAELQSIILKIGHRCASLPDQDIRSLEEILGYDQSGLLS